VEARRRPRPHLPFVGSDGLVGVGLIWCGLDEGGDGGVLEQVGDGVEVVAGELEWLQFEAVGSDADDRGFDGESPGRVRQLRGDGCDRVRPPVDSGRERFLDVGRGRGDEERGGRLGVVGLRVLSGAAQQLDRCVLGEAPDPFEGRQHVARAGEKDAERVSSGRGRQFERLAEDDRSGGLVVGVQVEQARVSEVEEHPSLPVGVGADGHEQRDG
jgi:hypothetical protein